MDYIDIIINRKYSINNEFSYGKYKMFSYWVLDIKNLWLETFMQEGCSKECTLNVKRHNDGVVL